MVAWQPMGQAADEAGALYEGIPGHMSQSLWSWIEMRLTHPLTHVSGRGLRADILQGFDRLSRRQTTTLYSMWQGGGLAHLRQGLNDEAAIEFVDYLVWYDWSHPTGEYMSGTQRLEVILRESGSAWTVGTRNGLAGLERRVAQGVLEAAEQAMATPGHAGSRLSEAWHKVYGVSPDPSSAYQLAIKAVEDAAIPVVVPGQSGATLGHVIGRLRSDANWSLPMTREDPAAPTADTVMRMCQTLWKGHHDRHGGVATAPATVNQDEAEAAVHLAVFLVQMFASGLIARR